MAQVAEHLLSRGKALSSNPNTLKKKEERKRKGRKEGREGGREGGRKEGSSLKVKKKIHIFFLNETINTPLFENSL
jgi:flagellar biosynthesis/type III secretory pathway protein FliH